MVKNLPANAGDMGPILGLVDWEDALEKEMATHSSREMRAFFSCMSWSTIPCPVSKLKRRLDSLEAAQGAPRDPRRDSRGPLGTVTAGSKPLNPGPGHDQPQGPVRETVPARAIPPLCEQGSWLDRL